MRKKTDLALRYVFSRSSVLTLVSNCKTKEGKVSIDANEQLDAKAYSKKGRTVLILFPRPTSRFPTEAEKQEKRSRGQTARSTKERHEKNEKQDEPPTADVI